MRGKGGRKEPACVLRVLRVSEVLMASASANPSSGTAPLTLHEKGKGKRPFGAVDAPGGGSISAPGAGGGAGFDLPWVEKYRPRLIRDVVGNRDAIARLEVIADQGNIPNLLLAGAPGTGKTTSILCMARQLLGSAVKEAVLELNASDERGIDVVRNRIKMFAQKKVTLPPGRHKIVILDEADSMTQAAQQALRRTMEIYSNTTRFALACNMSTKVIEPIQSRCAIVRFGRLPEDDILARLLHVCECEAVPKTPEGLEAVVFTADGDMRQALNNLQATCAGFGLVSQDNVFKVCDQPHPETLRASLESCIRGDVTGALVKIDDLWRLGYSAHDVVGTLFRVCKSLPREKISEYMKLEFIRQIGFCQVRVLEGSTSHLQIAGLLAKLCALANKANTKR